MLNLNPSGHGDEKQTCSTQVRHGESLAALIERAATALGVDKSVFLRSAIAQQARQVLEASSHHVLTPEDAARFAGALDMPPPSTPRALAAASDYRRRVAHAD